MEIAALNSPTRFSRAFQTGCLVCTPPRQLTDLLINKRVGPDWTWTACVVIGTSNKVMDTKMDNV